VLGMRGRACLRGRVKRWVRVAVRMARPAAWKAMRDIGGLDGRGFGMWWDELTGWIGTA